MMSVQKPTAEDVLDEALELVAAEMDDGWRHGVNVTETYKREEDHTFWRFTYRRSGDGDYNGLMEDSYQCVQVFPHEVTITQYLTYPKP
jgi:hypothetical protein